MNYIYDILLNFQKEYYEFYEWNKNDNIYHMRKIPIIKINDKQLIEIKNNIVKFDEKTLKYFNTKAERFKKNTITKMKNIIILTSIHDAIAIKINKNGITTYKSSLIPDEQEDAIEILKFQNEIILNYKIIKSTITNNFKTRFELEHEKFINNELTKIYKQNDFKQLNYLCLECFEHNEKDINMAYEKLKKEINETNNNFQKLYNIFKMTNQK